ILAIRFELLHNRSSGNNPVLKQEIYEIITLSSFWQCLKHLMEILYPYCKILNILQYDKAPNKKKATINTKNVETNSEDSATNAEDTITIAQENTITDIEEFTVNEDENNEVIDFTDNPEENFEKNQYLYNITYPAIDTNTKWRLESFFKELSLPF
ncbi:13565_t:CDS:2, partial [Dentiscutata erythropus]